MSMWADHQVKQLLAWKANIEKRLAALETTANTPEDMQNIPASLLTPAQSLEKRGPGRPRGS